MNNAPQMPRRASELPSSPTHVITLLIRQSAKRYAAIKEMLKNQIDGFVDLQKESQQLAQLMMQEDGGVDVRIHRLGVSLQAALTAAELNKLHLEQHLQAELFLQGELNRWVRGQPPTRFQGPPLPQNMQQPIVPNYAPPAQLPPAPQTQVAGDAAAQQAQAPMPPSYFRHGPNGLEPQSAAVLAQQQQQPQPQMPFPMPQYAMPPGYQQPPQVAQMPQMPQMPQIFMPPQPMMQQPMMPQQPMQQQFATPDQARQAVLPDAPPPPAVPTTVVHFPIPGAQPADGSQVNGAQQPQKQ